MTRAGIEPTIFRFVAQRSEKTVDVVNPPNDICVGGDEPRVSFRTSCYTYRAVQFVLITVGSCARASNKVEDLKTNIRIT